MDHVLLLAWLVLAHVVSDFVVQTDAMADRKSGDGPEAWRALGIHVALVGAILVPLVLIFGLRGLAFVAVTVASHLVIDRSKVILTRRAGWVQGAAVIPPAATEATEGPAFDRRWTPMPGMLFAADQLAHMAVLAVAWAVLLADVGPFPYAADLGARLAGSDPAAFHRTLLALVVVASLLIANVRAASMFVAMLVRPPHAPGDATRPSEAKVGAAIGILERLLICALVLGGAVATIGLVIAAKTLARFKQLDDREFAEYYLLGTLASVTVAVITSLFAQAALAGL